MLSASIIPLEEVLIFLIVMFPPPPDDFPEPLVRDVPVALPDEFDGGVGDSGREAEDDGCNVGTRSVLRARLEPAT